MDLNLNMLVLAHLRVANVILHTYKAIQIIFQIPTFVLLKRMPIKPLKFLVSTPRDETKNNRDGKEEKPLMWCLRLAVLS